MHVTEPPCPEKVCRKHGGCSESKMSHNLIVLSADPLYRNCVFGCIFSAVTGPLCMYRLSRNWSWAGEGSTACGPLSLSPFDSSVLDEKRWRRQT